MEYNANQNAITPMKMLEILNLKLEKRNCRKSFEGGQR